MGKKKRAKRAEAKVARLKKSLAAAHDELEKTRAKLQKAKDKAARWRKEAKKSSSGSGAAKQPDESWTVQQLREEAKTRGLTGMSNKPKAELLRALR